MQYALHNPGLHRQIEVTKSKETLETNEGHNFEFQWMGYACRGAVKEWKGPLELQGDVYCLEILGHEGDRSYKSKELEKMRIW